MKKSYPWFQKLYEPQFIFLTFPWICWITLVVSLGNVVNFVIMEKNFRVLIEQNSMGQNIEPILHNLHFSNPSTFVS